ncbi:RimK family alpha-L-glutamate ligase [Anaerotaenia torta]|uniref:ATP-grasp domain-containing protein n=1 Tax=Anaerotaenia torta TaxID=433293 RepID=UPI003D239C36
MRGILIVNEFLQSDKFQDIHDRLLSAALKHGIVMELRTNAQILMDTARKFPQNEADFILFWDKDVKLAAYLEQLGYPVFNSAKAIETCDNKALTHLVLMREGIPVPDTVIAPMTFENIGYTNYDFLEEVEERLGFPMVMKECFGSFGQQVYLVHNREECIERMKSIAGKPILFQKFLQTSFGRDIRLQVVGGKVIAGMYRYSENGDFRANLTIGGKMRAYEPTQKQQELAVRCCDTIGLDFAGVDILFGEEEEPLVCEVNSNAHFKNIYDCTGVDAAEAILKHIKESL